MLLVCLSIFKNLFLWTFFCFLVQQFSLIIILQTYYAMTAGTTNNGTYSYKCKGSCLKVFHECFHEVTIVNMIFCVGSNLAT